MRQNQKVEEKGIKYLVGIDEVGRGPLAGPLTICAFCLPIKNKNDKEIKNFLREARSSKKISEVKRNSIYKNIRQVYLDGKIKYTLSSARHSSIDKKGISKVTFLAIKRALERLNAEPNETEIFLDGSLKAPREYIFQKTIIRGDEKIKIISCASIIAKVKRDSLMKRMDKKYPEYGFKDHKGYGTKFHLNKIKKHGPSEIHRLSFLKNVKTK